MCDLFATLCFSARTLDLWVDEFVLSGHNVALSSLTSISFNLSEQRALSKTGTCECS